MANTHKSVSVYRTHNGIYLQEMKKMKKTNVVNVYLWTEQLILVRRLRFAFCASSVICCAAASALRNHEICLYMLALCHLLADASDNDCDVVLMGLREPFATY